MVDKKDYNKTVNPKGLKCYLNNQKIKAAKDSNGEVVESYEEWEVAELAKCSVSAKYFIENYCIIQTEKGAQKFKLFDCQRKTIDTLQDNRFTIILAPRQSGKCSIFSTKIKVRNKKTGVIEDVTIGEFHKRHKS